MTKTDAIKKSRLKVKQSLMEEEEPFEVTSQKRRHALALAIGKASSRRRASKRLCHNVNYHQIYESYKVNSGVTEDTNLPFQRCHAGSQ